MKTSKYSDSQIMAILKQASDGAPVPTLCREHGMSGATFYKWRSKYGGMDASLISRLKELEAENRRLKKMCADAIYAVIQGEIDRIVALNYKNPANDRCYSLRA
jgi:putative transposase